MMLGRRAQTRLIFIVLFGAGVGLLMFIAPTKTTEVAPPQIGTREIEGKLDRILHNQAQPDTAIMHPGTLDAIVVDTLSAEHGEIARELRRMNSLLDALNRNLQRHNR